MGRNREYVLQEYETMKHALLKSVAVAALAAQPLFAADAFAAALPAGSSSAQATGSDVLLAQNQNQNQNSNQNQNENQSGGNQNQNQNENQNQNQNRNRNENEEDGGVLAAATAQALDNPNHACFYAGSGFAGARYCVEPGQEAATIPPGWDDRISSIEIAGNVTVTVCADPGFAGLCKTYKTSASELPKDLDDAISSWKAQ